MLLKSSPFPSEKISALQRGYLLAVCFLCFFSPFSLLTFPFSGVKTSEWSMYRYYTLNAGLSKAKPGHNKNELYTLA